MDREALLRLAERIGDAGVDRESDALIWLHLPEQAGLRWKHNGDLFAHARQIEGCAFIPTYTASLDAAMTLVPERWDHMEVYRPDHQTLGWTVYLKPNANIGGGPWEAFAASFPLALTCAAIRAHAALAGE